MTTFTAVAGQVAGVLALAAFAPYVRAILRGETKPNRASWFIWLVVGVMLGASYFASGAKHTIWVPISYIIGPLVIAILSIKRGEGGWTRFDRVCLAVAATSLVLWWLCGEPRIALAINLCIDGLGALAAYPIYMVLASGIITALIVRPRIRQMKIQ